MPRIYLFFWSGLFRFQPEDGETFWHLMHQKGHWYLEVFISGVETLLFDITIGLVGWRYLLKPYMAQRQAQAIAGIMHSTGSMTTTPRLASRRDPSSLVWFPSSAVTSYLTPGCVSGPRCWPLSSCSSLGAFEQRIGRRNLGRRPVKTEQHREALVVSPQDGQVFHSADVPVKVMLHDAEIVAATTTNVVPDQGHLHISLDGEIV